MKRMEGDPAVKAYRISNEDHVVFRKSFFEGEPNYDVLFKE